MNYTKLVFVLLLSSVFSAQSAFSDEELLQIVQTSGFQSFCRTIGVVQEDQLASGLKIALVKQYLQKEKIEKDKIVDQREVDVLYGFYMFLKGLGFDPLTGNIPSDKDEQELLKIYKEENRIHSFPEITPALKKALVKKIYNLASLEEQVSFSRLSLACREATAHANQDDFEERFSEISFASMPKVIAPEEFSFEVTGPVDFSTCVQGYVANIFDASALQLRFGQFILATQSGHVALQCARIYVQLTESKVSEHDFWSLFYEEICKINEKLLIGRDSSYFESLLHKIVPQVRGNYTIIDTHLRVHSAAPDVSGDLQSLCHYLKTIIDEHGLHLLCIEQLTQQEAVRAAAAADSSDHNSSSWAILIIQKDRATRQCNYVLFSPCGTLGLKSSFMQELLVTLETI